MNARHIAVLLIAFAAGGCSMQDRIVTSLGFPPRGFMTPAVFADGRTATVAASVSVNGCTAAGCPQAPAFCAARGYQPGTDNYERCLVSVTQNLRNVR